MAFARRGKNGNGDYGGTYQKRTAWTAEEDEILKQQVARFGTHCWPEVAAGLSGRTSKACSLRWRCFLSPNIIRPNDEPFSPWEIAIIVLTQKVFGNKWNDIAAYLPMRCNNDIKNYFNLYLKEKTSVFSENCYLRSGYDLAQLLQAEPDEVMQRRQRLEAEKVSNNNIDPLKVPPRSLSPLPRKPSTPTKAKKGSSSSGPSSPSVRGGVAKGAKPSRMGLAAGSLSAMMSEGYCLDGSYAGYSTDASGMYHSQDMSAAAAAADHSAYLASMNSQGMYGSPAAAAAYYGSPAAVGQASAATAAGYTGGADSYTMHLAATASGSFAAELQQQQQQGQQASNQQQQQQGVVAMDVSTSAAGCGPAPVTSHLLTAAVGSGAFDSSMLRPADKCAAMGTPVLSAAKVAGMQDHRSSVCGGSPNDSDIYSPLMRFSIGDPDNILPVEPDHNDPIAAAMGVHWHRITSMDGTDFDSLLSEGGGELHAELQLTRMLAEYEPSVTSKPHSNAGSAGTCTESPTSTKPVPEHTAQQDIDMGCIKAEAAAAAAQEAPMSPPAAAAIDPAAAAAAPVDGPLPAVTVTVSRAAAEAMAGAARLQQQALLSPASVAGALAGGHLQHPALHVDVPSPSVSCGAPSQQQQQQQQHHIKAEPAVSSPQAATGHLKLHSSDGNDNSSGSPGSTHLSSVNINLGLVNPAIAHLVAGGERNATSAPCTMVAAYTPNGTYSPNPALPKGAFTQGSGLRPHSPTSSWQQAQQAAAHPQLSGLSAGQRPSPFKDLQHQQQHMHAMSDAWGAASPTTHSHKQHSHLSGMYNAASSHHHQLQLHAAHHQQQHMQSSSLLSSPAALAAAAGAAAAASGAFSSPLRSCAWAGSSAGVHSGEQKQQEQQQQPASAAAAAAAAIQSTGRWSQHNEGPLPLDVTHEDEADLARLFDADSDVAMASAPAVSAPSTAAAAAAAAGVCTSPMVGSGGGAVGEAATHDCTAKLESLIEELQTGAAPSSRLGSAPLNEVAGELLALPAWGSSSSGSLDHILSGECW